MGPKTIIDISQWCEEKVLVKKGIMIQSRTADNTTDCVRVVIFDENIRLKSWIRRYTSGGPAWFTLTSIYFFELIDTPEDLANPR